MSPQMLQPLLELPVTKFRGDLSSWLTKIGEGERLLLTVGKRPVAVLTAFGEYDNLRYLAERHQRAVDIVQAVVG